MSRLRRGEIVTASVAFVCRGPGSGQLTIVHCDAEACTASTSYSTAQEYTDAGRAGWRRVGEGAAAEHRCPLHGPTA